MKYTLLIFSFIAISIPGSAQSECYLNNETYTYDEVIHQYDSLSKAHEKYAKFEQYGSSDYGLPVSLFLINKSGNFFAREYQQKSVLLINNAIHPGEPCGVDASVKLAKDLLKDPSSLPDNVIIAIIPIYNIGGAHNRNCNSRTNQNGPKEYGFRGNSRNFDLNRDFIKADSKNTLAFYNIFHLLNPDVFIDTHTSNGADYQHIMTLITSQTNKMHPSLADFTRKTFNPALYDEMEKAGYPMVPYVHTYKSIPDNGIIDYLETPRYSTGYTNLFNTFSFVTETHMLKTFQQRVESTYAFLKIMVDFMEDNHQKIKSIRKEADQHISKTEKFDLAWELDTIHFDSLEFHGYEAEYHKSKVTGLDRLFYNREKPFKRYVRYYNIYKPTITVTRPDYYIIPQQWDKIVELLISNQISVYRLSKDKSANVEVYYITEFETVKSPYEGHYLHHSVKVRKDTLTIQYRKGDYIIPTRNPKARFIIETLEPHAVDSYLAWNYFDAILQQKEWFSPYVFEDEAPEILKKDPELKKAFEEKRKNDPEFAKNAWAQLYYIYQHSDHYEPTHNQYPVTRFNGVLGTGEVEEVLPLRTR